MNNIAEAIRRMAQGDRQTVSLVCTVDAVDRESRTVDCTPLDEGAPLLGVNLQANQSSTFGMVAFPRVGSYVVVGFVADGDAGIVLMTDDIESAEVVVSDTTSRVLIDEKCVRIDVGEETSAELTKDGVVMNGGSFGGLIKIQELTDKVNELVDKFNNHTHTVDAGIALTAGSYSGVTTAPGSAQSPTGKAMKLNKADYEDEKVKH